MREVMERLGARFSRGSIRYVMFASFTISALVAVLRAPAPGLLGELAALTGSRQCLALLVDADVEASTDLAAAGWLVHSCTSGEEIAAMWSRTLEAWSHQ